VAQGETGAGPGRSSADARVARVERWLDLGVLVVGAGVVLLGAGLIRDLAWLRLAGRPVPVRRAVRR
jgi:hypothetical protein